MTEIVLNGVSITELKKQKALIQRDASAFIAKGIKEAEAVIQQIIEAGEDAEYGAVEKLGRTATEILENVKIVSDVSGVEYCLPYNEPYCGGDALSDDLEGMAEVFNLGGLIDVLQEMEYNSFCWNSSSIGC